MLSVRPGEPGHEDENHEHQKGPEPHLLTYAPHDRNDGADPDAERRPRQDIHRVVVSTDHARHANADGDTQQNGPVTGNDEITPIATAIVTAT